MKFKILALVAFVFFVAFKVDDRYFEIAKNLEIFGQLYKEVNTLYVDEVNPNQSMDRAIKAILKDMDPYTVFYPEDLIENARLERAELYNGIGVKLNDNKVIVDIEKGSAADEDKLRIGDKITHVNSIDVSKLEKEQVATLLKGENGSKVVIKVLPYNSNKATELNLVRMPTKTTDVGLISMVDETTGYIQLTTFKKTASSEIKHAYISLKAKGMKNLIVDLRNNGGGLLNEAVNICNFFIPQNKLVVATKGKVAEWNKEYLAKEKPLDLDMPLAILINSGSASASEIVSGTLQDYDRAVVIGQRSFGKGLVQQYRPLSYNTMAKVTVAKYYTPSGRCIQALDYSNRNPDGSVGKVPESLITKFKTENNRVVYDGGGIMPDIEVSKLKKSKYISKLIEDELFFNFANEFKNKTANIKPGFKASEELINDFKNYIKKQKYEYQSEASKTLEDFYAQVEDKGKLESDYKALENQLKKQESTLFETNKSLIAEELRIEITRRYKLVNEPDFLEDKEVQEAVSVFNSNKYKSILKK